jgi:hypothetical protein
VIGMPYAMVANIFEGVLITVPFYTCIVNEVGPAADGTETTAPVIYINLTDTAGSFTNTWFYAAQGIQEQALDVGVSAIEGPYQVEVVATAPNIGGSLLSPPNDRTRSGISASCDELTG